MITIMTNDAIMITAIITDNSIDNSIDNNTDNKPTSSSFEVTNMIRRAKVPLPN